MKKERPFVRWELRNKPSKRSFNMIVLQLTQVKRTQIERPKECPHCEGETFQRWGKQTRRVKDSQIRTVKVYRYRCTSCSRTFRHYPEGITHAQQSERMKQLAVICWSFGLSYRKVEAILSAFGVSLSRMSSWRDVQAGAEGIRRKKKWKPVRVVGVDGAWLNGEGVMVAVNLGDGEPLAIGAVDEKDMAAVTRWLKRLKQEHNIGAIVTDDLAMYRGITDRLVLGHQVCHFHVRRWVGRACWDLGQRLPEEWLWIIEHIKVIMQDLPPDGGKQLLDMYRQLPGHRKHGEDRTAVDELRYLLIRISENWDRYTTFFHDPGIPWTNNRTEQAIGRMKMRAKTTRGYKTKSGMLNGLLVSSTSLC
jgi:transposase-like protein